MSGSIDQIRRLLILFPCVYSLNGCCGQPKNSDTCISHFKNASAAVSSYQESNDQQFLSVALHEVGQSTACTETRQAAVELKISLLMLLKEFREAYVYVDSLNETDFKLKYKKSMWHNYFLASEYGSQLDTVNEVKYFNEAIRAIQNYIQSENKHQGQLDEEAYFDLFNIKKKVATQQQIETEIDSLKGEYPSKRSYFTGLKTTLFDIPGQAKAIADPQ